MSLGRMRHWMAGVPLVLLALTVGAQMFCPPPAQAQEVLARKAKIKVAPQYPDMARRMNISGTVRVIVVVAPNGTLKSTKVVGGHPLLVNAAVDALRKWKFEPATDESSGIVEFKFQGQQ